MNIRNYLLSLDLDKIFPRMIIIISVILIAILSILGSRLIYITSLVFTLISCIIWVLINHKSSLNEKYILSDSKSLILTIIFFILVTLIILSLHFRTNFYERPLIYFFLISLMYGIVSLEIMFYSSNKKILFLILSQIIILSLFSAWSLYLIFPNVIGIDSWAHQSLTRMIVDTGFIPNEYKYSKIPLMHLEIGSVSLTTGLNYKFATMLSISLIQVLCGVLFVYLLGRFFFNTKTGLLAGLLVTAGNYFIVNSFWAVPTSIAAVLMLITIYLFFKFRLKNHLIGISLIILFMISIIFTHTVVSMCTAIILFTGWLAINLYSKFFKKYGIIPITLNICLFFSITMFAWWIYVTGHIHVLADLIKLGFSPEFFIRAPSIIYDYSNNVPFFEQLFNLSGRFLFFSLSLIGCFYMVSKRYGNSLSILMVIFGVVPLVIGFSTQIIGLAVIQERWMYFAQIFLVIPLTISFLLIYNYIKRKSLKKIFLFTLTIIFTFVLITNPSVNMDNHFFSPNTGIRLTFTESEINAASFFVEKSMTNLSSDFDFFTNPSSSVPINYYFLNGSRIIPLDSSLLNKKFDLDRSVIVLRQEILNRPFRLFGLPYKLTYNPKQVLFNQNFSTIYDCNSVYGFYRMK